MLITSLISPMTNTLLTSLIPLIPLIPLISLISSFNYVLIHPLLVASFEIGDDCPQAGTRHDNKGLHVLDIYLRICGYNSLRASVKYLLL